MRWYRVRSLRSLGRAKPPMVEAQPELDELLEQASPEPDTETDDDEGSTDLLRRKCSQVFVNQRVHVVVGTLQFLMVDALVSVPNLDETRCLAAFDTIAENIRSLIRQRCSAAAVAKNRRAPRNAQ